MEKLLQYRGILCLFLICLSNWTYAIDDSEIVDHNLLSEEKPTTTITAIVSNYECQDRGTSDPNDDYFSFDLDVTGGSGTDWKVSLISGSLFPYGTVVHFDSINTNAPFFEISNGTYTITIKDAVDSSCSTTVNITPPSSCSSSCPWQLGTDTGDVSSTITRDDNGTPSFPDDDKVSGVFTLLVPSAEDWLLDVKSPTDNSSYLSYGPFPSTQTSYAWGPIDLSSFVANSQDGFLFRYSQDGDSACAGDYWLSFPSSRIGDFVWYDANNSGLFDNGESPAKDIIVDLYNSNGVFLGSEETDESGFYSFYNLPEGDYNVVFKLPNDFRGSKQLAGIPNGNIIDEQGLANSISVGAGGFKRNIDAGIIRKNVSGSVWEDTNINGTQEWSEPVLEGVEVILRNGSGTEIEQTLTNSNGEYSFVNIPIGTYYVDFSLPLGFVSGTFRDSNGTDLVDSGDSDMDPDTRRTGTFDIISTRGDSKSNISGGFSRIPLPVELISFTAEIFDCRTRLIWSSATEQEFDYYQIERSTDGTDFKSLDWILGEGSEAEAASYLYIDSGVNFSGVVYYRLKMVDLDESYEYSEMTTVSYRDCKSAYDEIKVYPNPTLANTELTIEFPFWNESISLDQVKVIITDLSGKKTKEIVTSSFENGKAKMSTVGLDAGAYFIHILDDEGIEIWVGNVMIQE